MEVFKNEGNVSQDANFRAHLDDNWDSGNREFDKIEGQLETALDDIQFLKTEIHDLQGDVKVLNQHCDKIEEKHNDDIDALNKVIASQDERITKLEKAVFEAQYINDTDDVAGYDKSVVSQDINDTNAIDDDDGLIIEQDNYKSLLSDIN